MTIEEHLSYQQRLTIYDAKIKIEEAEKAIEAIIQNLESEGLKPITVEFNKRLVLPGSVPQSTYSIKIKVNI